MAINTLQGLLEQHLPKVLHTIKLPLYQHKALERLSVCRTQSLGGHAQYCPKGHLNGIWYNSCKHRACPQCQGMAKEEWLRNTHNILLNCPHHHVVFTLPEALNDLWRFNRELMANVLFQSVNETLQQFARDPKYLNAEPGLLSALHTWGRNLSLHPHLHVLISHGGLNTEGQWVTPKKKHLFPQKPVMMVYRGKLLDKLRKHLSRGELALPTGSARHQVKAELNKLGRREWVVYFCERYDDANGVAKYLARYVKGGPMRNQQLKRVGENDLTFSYKSHQTKRREKLKLSHEAFVLRLVQHIPLPKKQTVRYSGLYSVRKRDRLNEARKQLGQRAVHRRVKLDWKVYLKSLNIIVTCDRCGLPIHHGEAVVRKKQAH